MGVSHKLKNLQSNAVLVPVFQKLIQKDNLTLLINSACVNAISEQE
jgi:hypothetical protein